MSECELACPPSGHVTTLVNNLHYFCWPSQSVDVFFSIGIFIKFDGFCGFLSSVVRHLCWQCLLRTKLKKHRGKVLLWTFYGGLSATISKMAALMFRCWMKRIPLFRIQFFLQKACVSWRWAKFFYFYIFCPLDWRFTTIYTETVGSLTSSGRDSLQVARQPRKSPWKTIRLL